jgi:uncharacterized protein (TIGR02145 family)/uncharacterized repeat protein (TIGR02543 family)
MKRQIILPLAALLAVLSCTDTDFKRNNPWDSGGENYNDGHWTLTVEISPPGGGNVSSSVGTGVSSGTYHYYEETSDRISARANTGYKFTGWSDAATGTANPVTITMNGNKRLVAIFQDTTTPPQPPQNAYSITFNANGGTVTPASANTNNNGQLTSLPTPTRSGYTFDGWYTAATGGTTVNESRVYTADATIYARWTAEPVTPPSGGTFADSRDGKTYKKVAIGTQVWMAENLNYDVPNNETDVCYNNSSDNCSKYGRLYNWEAAMKACPAGWHLPSDAEWTQLTDFVGSNAGTKLKATSGWYNNGNGGDNYGFAALPAGYGYSGGSFYGAGYGGYWWSPTEKGADYAYGRSMGYDIEFVGRYYNYESYLFSVRCVQD